MSVPVDEEKDEYLQGPWDILKSSILLECIRGSSKKQQNIPLLRFRHRWGPMLVPI